VREYATPASPIAMIAAARAMKVVLRVFCVRRIQLLGGR
jgi:hypothetical protein